MFLTGRFALGDSRRPLHETAALVEDIVHTQLINLVSVNISQRKSLYFHNVTDILGFDRLLKSRQKYY